MSSLLKGGWHPKGKDGSSEKSLRSEFKGIDQIASKFGKGRAASDDRSEREQHVSRPLSSLRDPSTFGPPPKHSAYYGGAASSTGTSSRPPTGPTSLGGAIPRETIEHQQQQAAWQTQQEEQEQEKPPPGPYQVNTTGLSTANLPKPPVRRVDNTLPPPPPRSTHSSPAPPPRTAFTSPPSRSAAAGGPRLPPRLPPRQNSRPDMHTPEPPPDYNTASNIPSPDPSSLHRLGAAGVSVPGFDIGGTRQATPPARPHHSTPPGAPQAQQVNELQSRFRTMQFGAPTPPSPSASHTAVHTPSPPLHSSTSFGSSSTNTATGAGSTTWDQKRHAASTAAAFHKDPTSVSLSDARSAATTANSFRERHGESVKSGYAAAREMGNKYGQQAREANAKYGVTDKAKGYAGGIAGFNRSAPSTGGGAGTGSAVSSTGTGSASGGGAAAATQKKVLPPPPPPKKKELSGGGIGGDAPPPVPLGSKPR